MPPRVTVVTPMRTSRILTIEPTADECLYALSLSQREVFDCSSCYAASCTKRKEIAPYSQCTKLNNSHAFFSATVFLQQHFEPEIIRTCISLTGVKCFIQSEIGFSFQ
uniref:Uncharacterized protein n=1 Tax=Anguilla anguilla TaxID=7936 RepID=A0A0E9WLE9_ANGAN